MNPWIFVSQSLSAAAGIINLFFCFLLHPPSQLKDVVVNLELYFCSPKHQPHLGRSCLWLPLVDSVFLKWSLTFQINEFVSHCKTENEICLAVATDIIQHIQNGGVLATPVSHTHPAHTELLTCAMKWACSDVLVRLGCFFGCGTSPFPSSVGSNSALPYLGLCWSHSSDGGELHSLHQSPWWAEFCSDVIVQEQLFLRYDWLLSCQIAFGNVESLGWL